MRHLRHYKLQMFYICKNKNVIYFLVKVVSQRFLLYIMLDQISVTLCDAGPSLMHYWINTWHKKKRSNFKMLLFHDIYSKPFD